MKNGFTQIIHFLGGIALLFRDIVLELKTKPFYFKIFLRQIYEIGWKSLPIIFVTSACAGMVLTLQFGFTLEKFGGKIYSPKFYLFLYSENLALFSLVLF